MLWGYSEAIDFYSEYKKYHESASDSSELKVLLFGSCDPRHILKTLAKSYLHNTKFHFYIVEGCPALIARQILLISIALEQVDLLTLKTRVHLLMDIYGNSQLRSSSVGYINSKANHLIKCITDLEFNGQMQPIFDLNQLKYIERDCLENVLNFWREKKQNRYDIANLWMQRIRQSLNDRFDSRDGAYDWDHQMRLKDNGAHQICSQEYKHWRETGVAFTFPEYRQSHANKTFSMASTGPSSGYVGDITIGPFCTFGLSCSDPKLMKSNHGQNDYRATDITEFNLFEILYEIHERQPFNADSFATHKLGNTRINTGKILDANTTPFDHDLKRFNAPLVATQQVQISFISISDAQSLAEGSKFHKMFDMLFVGRSFFKLLKTSFANTFAANAAVLFETGQLSVSRKPDVADFLQQIRDAAKKMRLKSLNNFHINLPLPIARFANAEPSSESDEQWKCKFRTILSVSHGKTSNKFWFTHLIIMS